MLVDRITAYAKNHFGYAKALWDVGAIAYLVNPKFATARLIKTFNVVDMPPYPIVENAAAHDMVTLDRIDRTLIFRDLFTKLAKFDN